MDVRNCRKCGRIFNYIQGPPICPNCVQAMEETFQKVKEYLRNTPGASVSQTAIDCEVDIGQIRAWVREERLTFSSAEGSDIFCENCGVPIATGRFCEKCKSDMAHGLGESIRKPEIPQPVAPKPTANGNRMRFMNRGDQ